MDNTAYTSHESDIQSGSKITEDESGKKECGSEGQIGITGGVHPLDGHKVANREEDIWVDLVPQEKPRNLAKSRQGQGGGPQEKSSWWRPASVSSYVAVLSALLLAEMTLATYSVGVLRTLEKRFSFSSRQSGLIFAMNDVAHICVCTFVGYFGDRYHKPRIISITTVFVILSAVLMSCPALLPSTIAAPQADQPEQNISAATKPLFSSGLCRPNVTVEECASTTVDAETSTTNTAFVIFVVAMLMNGIGGSAFSSIGISFVDENAPPSKTSLYIGIVTAMYAIGPILGFVMAALCLRFPEDLSSDLRLSPMDPGFIGAWWIGYVLIAAVAIVASIPMWFFPKVLSTHRSLMKKGEERNDELKDGTKESVMTQVKAFPSALMRLLRNKAYVCMLIFSVLLTYLILGVFAGLTRYLEIHFRLPAFTSNIVTVDSALAGAIGGLAGGVYMSKRKLGPTASSKLLVLSWGATVAGLLILMLLACPQPELAGLKTDDGFSLTETCNADCGCVTQNRRAFRPVCGNDGLTYFSACHAGCSQRYKNGLYGSCQCVTTDFVNKSINMLADDTSMRSDEWSASGTAVSGVCGQFCKTIYPFAIVMFVMCMLGSICRVPITTVQLRIVNEKDRSFGLGFNSFAYNLLGFIPAPLLYGFLLDSSCILWQKGCNGSGSCLIYDTRSVRLLTYGVTLVLQVLALAATIALVFFVKRMPVMTQALEVEITALDDAKHEKDSKEPDGNYIADDN